MSPSSFVQGYQLLSYLIATVLTYAGWPNFLTLVIVIASWLTVVVSVTVLLEALPVPAVSEIINFLFEPSDFLPQKA